MSYKNRPTTTERPCKLPRPLAPSSFDRRVSERSADPVDLFNAVQLAVRGRQDVTAQGIDRITAPTDASDFSAEDFESFVQDVDSRVEIRSAAGRYRIAYGFDVDHTDGEGGAAVSVSELRRDGMPVLMSVSRTFYTTGNDDADTPSGRQDDLYLIDNADPLGQLVFALLAQ